jgi:thiol-disulfide isomerase/thioredoxin
VPDSRVLKQAEDFTITTTDGITRNLYNTLDSGKTVFVDLFYTTCSWCQYYAPVIEEIYQNHGAGQGDIEFWGVSNNLNDPDAVIDQYRSNFNVSNPCAGPDGGGTTAHTIIIAGQNFQGWPTYCVICPDRTLYFDPCYPPTVTGFDPFFTQCAATIGISDNLPVPAVTAINAIYPNPASTDMTLEISVAVSHPVTVGFYNLLGVKVASASYVVAAGRQKIVIPIDQLANGVYFLKMMQDGQFIDTQKAWISR